MDKNYSFAVNGNVYVTLKGTDQEKARGLLEKYLEGDYTREEYKQLAKMIEPKKLEALAELSNYEIYDDADMN